MTTTTTTLRRPGRYSPAPEVSPNLVIPGYLSSLPVNNRRFERLNDSAIALMRRAGEIQEFGDYGGYLQLDTERCAGYQSGNRPPWVEAPPEADRVRTITGVALPAEGVETVITQYTIPYGYDAVIKQHLNIYTGTGFAEFSGDITWRIKINQWYVESYSVIQSTMGSLQIPVDMDGGGIRVRSGQTVSYVVELGTGALGRLSGGKLVGGLFGWQYGLR